jgi:ABC-2 type transport system ATP-binding protein
MAWQRHNFRHQSKIRTNVTETLLEAKELTKRYGAVTALDRVSFSIQRGEIFGLLGPNGAGKTTALHILLGVLTPTEGEARVFGLTPDKDRRALYPRINFSSAYVQLPFNLSARQNLDIYARLYGIKNRAEKIHHLLTTFQLTHRADSRTGHLSSGEQTRLNLCKSLLNDPELLFLDEPTASLDPDISDLVRETLKTFQSRSGLTIIYTSHNMAEVESLCNRVLFIHRGKKIIEGTPKHVQTHFQQESLEKVFIHLARSGDVLDAAKKDPS